jgi:hypothetical protein
MKTESVGFAEEILRRLPDDCLVCIYIDGKEPYYSIKATELKIKALRNEQSITSSESRLFIEMAYFEIVTNPDSL